MRLLALILFVLMAFSCEEDDGEEGNIGDGDAMGDIMEVTVGPDLVDCTGVAPMKCMVVDGGYFYNRIEGFEHEAGYRYKLRIERYDRWGGKEPPQDAGKYGYRLIEVMEKAMVSP